MPLKSRSSENKIFIPIIHFDDLRLQRDFKLFTYVNVHMCIYELDN